jgi:hypothetical protein
MLDPVLKTFRWLALVGAVIAVAGCASLGSIGGALLGSPVELDHVTLAADGRSVDAVVVGGAPLSEGKPCGTDYALASSTISGTTLEVLVKQTAERQGECVLTELVCCEHRFTIELPADHPVDRVRDLGAPFDRVFFLTRPIGLYELRGLPAGWDLRREWADWGGTWTRLYSPLVDPQPGSLDTLTFSTTFGGQIVTEPEALQSPVIVNGSEAQYQRYPDVDNEIQLQWLAQGQMLTLETYERNFSIDDLVALANSPTAP